MEERERKTSKGFISKVLIILNVLFLFYFNAHQVSAEDLNNHFDERQPREELTSEETTSEQERDTETEVGERGSEEETLQKDQGFEEEIPREELLQEKTEEGKETSLGSSDKINDEKELQSENEEAENTQSDEVNGSDKSGQENFEEEEPAEASDEDSSNGDSSIEDDKEQNESATEENINLEDNSEEQELLEEDDEQTAKINEEKREENETGEFKDQRETDFSAESASLQSTAFPMAATAATAATETDEEDSVDRIAGSNRYKNAVEISKAGWENASTVVIANGEKFADSLTGSPLASLYDAPILLTKSGQLPEETLAEVKRLNPDEIIVLGGEVSVSDSILGNLQNNGFKTRRIGGQNRYSLAENIAKEVMDEEGLQRDAFLANGELFSDAMSIAPVAASKRLPIFLTRGHTLHQTVINAIPYVNSWTIIGGFDTIDESVEAQMRQLGAETQRIGGKNRYEVNRNVIQYYGAPGDHMYVASGEHFSDALPASVLAAKEDSAVLLVKNNNKTTLKEQKDFAEEKNTNRYTLVGGTATLSQATEDYFKHSPYVVYLDPGHGGWESGASYHGVQEKDLNLSVSKKISQILGDRGYEVLMSRTTDRYVDLYERADDANRSNADIFVSIHHNAMPNNSSVSGIENFYYKYDHDDTYKPRNPESETYRKATSQKRATESLELANAIHNELIQDTGANNRGVKEMSFAVIRETTMPAVLLELGFMSNWFELSKLVTDNYQNLLARSVADGIDRYFQTTL